jgi:hypothetical protein
MRTSNRGEMDILDEFIQCLIRKRDHFYFLFSWRNENYYLIIFLNIINNMLINIL